MSQLINRTLAPRHSTLNATCNSISSINDNCNNAMINRNNSIAGGLSSFAASRCFLVAVLGSLALFQISHGIRNTTMIADTLVLSGGSNGMNSSSTPPIVHGWFGRHSHIANLWLWASASIATLRTGGRSPDADAITITTITTTTTTTTQQRVPIRPLVGASLDTALLHSYVGNMFHKELSLYEQKQKQQLQQQQQLLLQQLEETGKTTQPPAARMSGHNDEQRGQEQTQRRRVGGNNNQAESAFFSDSVQDVVNEVIAPTVATSTLHKHYDPLQSFKPSNQLSMFYNVFIPFNKGKEGVANALRIVVEQIGQVATSKTVRELGKDFTLYVVTIGMKNGLPREFLYDVCERRNNITCHHLQHYDQGFEEVTLQKLYEYCHEYPTHKVAYMHSKGSYHFSNGNERWRGHMTNAIVDSNCIYPPDNTCNVCGLLFYPIWMPMFPGNFWTGQCEYIRKLAPPNQFVQISYDSQKEPMDTKNNPMNFTNLMYKIEGWTIGLDRYASEAWVTSHPEIRPCDLTDQSDVRFWLRERNASDYFTWSMAPRLPLAQTQWFMVRYRALNDKLLHDESLRKREYFLLAGKLYKWFRIYNTTPPADSWIWQWFPDGLEWRAAVEQYGAAAVSHVIQRALTTTQQQVTKK